VQQGAVGVRDPLRGGQRLQGAAQSRVAPLGSHLQRRHALSGRLPREFGSCRSQQAHRVDVLRGVLTQPDRLVDRLVPDPVHVVALDAGSQKSSDDVGVAPLGRPDQCRAVPAVLVVHTRAVAEGQVEEVGVPLARRDEVRRLLRAVLGVDVGTSGDEPPGAP
jgi:hypothetical protein